MDGIGDILPALWQMLGGGAQTAQTPAAPVPAGRLGMVPATATGQPPTPAPATGVGGLGGLLANPATQGILSAYFGYLGRPRGLFTNRWQGLGQAGLAGLQGYEQAREQQLKLPLEQAQLQEAQAQIPKVKAETEKLTQESEAWKSLPPDLQKYRVLPPGVATLEQTQASNQALGHQLDAEAGTPGLDPRIAQRLHQNAEFARKSSTPQSIKDLRDDAYKDPALEQQLKEAQRKHLTKETEHIGEPPLPTPAGPKDLEKQVLDEAKTAYPNRSWKEYKLTFDQYLQKYRAQRMPELQKEMGAGAGPKTETGDILSGPPPADAGATWTGRTGNGGTMKEYRYKDGSVHWAPAGAATSPSAAPIAAPTPVPAGLS